MGVEVSDMEVEVLVLEESVVVVQALVVGSVVVEEVDKVAMKSV